ncbi:MAG: hypothetical protein A3F72_09640 [Bacteroidetes bacterium RIFCSPLOWO2_12_FULL_35_15]|nr:MAG: hypothetical protein A3F72_09640 [Bacteroidetes bacterium RIFCSPLOWO2_12_FULL_35_15]
MIRKILLINIVLLGGCNTTTTDKKSISEKEYYSNGNISAESIVINDTIKNYKTYYESGSLKSMGNYKGEKPEGFHVWYYKNGITETESQFQNGLLVGGTTKFFTNGNIKKYCFYNDNSDLMYINTYDSLGSLIGTQGRLIVSIKYKSPIKVGREMTADYLIATPPDSKGDLIIKEIFDSKIIINKKYNIDSSNFRYSKIYQTVGKYQLIMKVVVNDTMRKRTFVDVDTTSIEVVP